MSTAEFRLIQERRRAVIRLLPPLVISDARFDEALIVRENALRLAQ